MSKNIRQRIFHAIQTTFRLSPQHKQTSSTKSKSTPCCSVNKPTDYKYVSYQRQQTSTNNNYIDLSECHSWSSTHSKDSGISCDSKENSHPLQSTKTYSDDSSSLSTFSNLSYIPHDQVYDVTMRQSTFECCRCHCHHYMNNNQLLGGINSSSYVPEKYQQKQMKTKIYPFIF